jgi:AraC family transcriptional regulator
MSERDRLIPLLLNIEEDLEQDLSLGALASRFGASEFHFHRRFKDSVGETPKQHVERLRLEKAALQIAVSEQPITELAFSLGFRNLETFSRRFKSAFGHSPTGYRKLAQAAQAQRVQSHDFHNSSEYYLSRARFGSLPDMHLLALRHLGDYGALNTSFGADDSPWAEVRKLAATIEPNPAPVFTAFFLDDPTQTPEAQRRADVCVVLRAKPEVTGKARYIHFKGGPYASAEYVGDSMHLLHAYQGLADEIRRSPRYAFRSVSALMFPRLANVDGRSGIHNYEVCFPVELKRG